MLRRGNGGEQGDNSTGAGLDIGLVSKGEFTCRDGEDDKKETTRKCETRESGIRGSVPLYDVHTTTDLPTSGS